ncbi:44_t:CDS:2, partial [Gigaspora rosea]
QLQNSYSFTPKKFRDEIIIEIAKQILQNRYGFSKDQINALFSTQENESKSALLCNKLSIRDIRAEVYALALSAKMPILRDNQKKAEANRIDYSDKFILESVKEKLDSYDTRFTCSHRCYDNA